MQTEGTALLTGKTAKGHGLLYKSLFADASDFFFVIDEPGCFEFVNDECEHLFGFSSSGLLGKSIFSFIVEDDLPKFRQFKNILKAGQEGEPIVVACLHKDGTLQSVRIKVSWHQDENLFYCLAKRHPAKPENLLYASTEEERYRSLFEETPFPCWVFEKETKKIVEVNKKAVGHYGYSKEEFLSMTLLDLRPREDIPCFLENYDKGPQDEGSNYFGRHRHKKKNGEIILVEVYGHLLQTSAGRFMSVVVNDVTEKEFNQREIAFIKERLELVNQATYCAVWDWDIERNTVYQSEMYTTIFGYETGLNQFTLWSNNIHPHDKQRILQQVEEALSDPTKYSNRLEYRFFRADRTIANIVDRGVIIRDAAGKAIRMVGAMQDISELKEKEHQLKLFQSIINKTNDAIIISKAEPLCEPVGPQVVYVNEAFTQTTGYLPEEIIGKTPRILQGPGTSTKTIKKLGADLRAWKHCDVDMLNYKKNGEQFWVNLSIAPVADETGWFTHWVSIQKDITHKKNEEIVRRIIAQISDVFSKGLGLDETLQIALKEICTIGGFELAEVWVTDIDQRGIHKRAGFGANQACQSFLKKTNHCNFFLKGEGLPGYTWETGRLQLWNDPKNEPRFIRREAAVKAKLGTVYGVPLNSSSQTLGVLVLASNDMAPKIWSCDLDKVGEHLGIEIKRKSVEEEFEYLFTSSPDIICMAGKDGYFKKVNPAATQLLGYTREELLALPIFDLLHPSDRGKAALKWQGMFQDNMTGAFENRFVTKGGKTKYILWSYSVFKNEEYVLAIAKDLTDKYELEQMVIAERIAAEKGISRAIIETQEKERSVVGKELHDNVNQILTTVKLYVENVKNFPDQMDNFLAKSVTLTQKAINEIRFLAKQLVTPVIEDLDFKSTIEELLTHYQSLRVYDIDLQYTLKKEIHKDLQLTLYRIVQEQLNNIVKYAQASAIAVSVHQAGNILTLVVEDNGVGFDTQKHASGIGLTNIKNRTEIYGGSCQIKSAPGQGCRLEVSFKI